jgi:hypothetical protein
MKALNTKLVLSALGIALLATPALAQQVDRQQSPQSQYQIHRTNGSEFGNRVGANGTPSDNTATTTGGDEMGW